MFDKDFNKAIFLLGGKGNPRSGLLEALGNASCILDVCVGTAASSIQVAARYRQSQIVGVDISDAMLSVAQKKIARKQLANIELKNMPADAMQFADNNFDAVIVSFALHEIEEELRETIFKEVVRVLKPGGRFCVIDFAHQNNYSNQVFLKVWTRIEPPCFSAFLDMDWGSELNVYGLQFESEKEYSFSKLYILRKA